MQSEPYWNVVSKACQAVSIKDGPNVFLNGFNALDRNVADLLAAHWVVSEVSAGGLLGFFIGDAGVLAPEAAAAFDALDLPEAAEILREAIDVFDRPYPRERSRRVEFLARTPWNSLPEPDWKLLDAEPFERLDLSFTELAGSQLDKIRERMNDCAERLDFCLPDCGLEPAQQQRVARLN